jgi:hypothetical protein
MSEVIHPNGKQPKYMFEKLRKTQSLSSLAIIASSAADCCFTLSRRIVGLIRWQEQFCF